MTRRRTYLFVYGTLRKEFELPIKENIAEHIAWCGYGQIKARLYDIGEYPGAVADSEGGGIVKGEILQINDPGRVFKILDAYEGYSQKNKESSEFLRQQYTINCEGGITLKGWVYCYNLPVKNKRRIRHQDYVKYLRLKQLA